MSATSTGDARCSWRHACVLLSAATLAGNAVGQLQWERRPLFGRFTTPIAYDANRARMVLYAAGWQVPGGPETWEWDGVAWQMRSAAPTPPPGNGNALAYDLLRGRTVLFNGSDTWEWNGTTWLAMQPANRPPVRWGAAMAFDAARGCTVLFGGHWLQYVNGTITFGYFADTWEWDGVNWVQRAPGISPPGRFAHAMSYDVLRSRVVLFGGTGFSMLNDTWEGGGVVWTQRQPAQQPSPRGGCGLAYDQLRARTVRFR